MITRIPPLLMIAMLFAAGCATQTKPQPRSHTKYAVGTMHNVRTTAYTHTEAGGRHNAIGSKLACGKVTSAASDWSKFPLGTKFLLVKTGEVFQIDDYGSALVGKETIDLYRSSRMSMRDWGVRYVDIKILEWGSPEKSLATLQPRSRSSYVRLMIAGLQHQL